MENFKKTALLKQCEGWQSFLPIRGVARYNADKNSLQLSILNLESKENGEFYLLFGDNLLRLESLTGQEFFNLQIPVKNQTVALVFYSREEVFPIATGSFSSREINLEEVIINAEEHLKNQGKGTQKTTALQVESYDDEAIATENYYERESVFERGEECLNEGSADNESLSRSKKEQGKEEKEGIFSPNEPISSGDSEQVQEHEPWRYEKIKDSIESILARYPSEEGLCNMVENSKWVRIDGGARHYAVGVILDKGEVEFICYGLPSCFEQKPQGAEGFDFFIPISPFDLKGEGYWVSIQSAKNGKCV